MLQTQRPRVFGPVGRRCSGNPFRQRRPLRFQQSRGMGSVKRAQKTARRPQRTEKGPYPKTEPSRTKSSRALHTYTHKGLARGGLAYRAKRSGTAAPLPPLRRGGFVGPVGTAFSALRPIIGAVEFLCRQDQEGAPLALQMEPDRRRHHPVPGDPAAGAA